MKINGETSFLVNSVMVVRTVYTTVKGRFSPKTASLFQDSCEESEFLRCFRRRLVSYVADSRQEIERHSPDRLDEFNRLRMVQLVDAYTRVSETGQKNQLLASYKGDALTVDLAEIGHFLDTANHFPGRVRFAGVASASS